MTAEPKRLGRAVVLGTVLVVLNVVWVTMVEVRYYMLDGSSLPLFITPVFLLFVLVGCNFLVRRVAPRRALSQEEMLLAYLMAVISNTFAGHDMLQNLFGQITHPYYFAAQNQWQDTFLRHLPQGLFIRDEAALNAWYRGNTPRGTAVGYLVHWSVPLALWGVFFLALVFLWACLTLLFRRAWTESERLAFPIIQLPLALTEPTGSLFRAPVMWIGFALAFGVGVLNGIHELYPAVPNWPYIKLYDIGQYFTIQPFEAVRTYGMQTSLYPFAIGLAYFIPLDLGFSCWFSYLFARGYLVAGRAAGWDGPSAGQGWPFLKEISAGAWIGVAVAILWTNREHLAASFDTAFGVRHALDDASDKRLARWGWIGSAGAFTFLIAWCYFLLNLSPVVSVAFFAIMLALSLAITRVRAEFGTPHEIVLVKPGDILVTLLGTRVLGDTNLIGMQTMYWFNRGYRCHPMPNCLEAYKMGEGKSEQSLLSPRVLGRVFALACVVSLVVSYASNYFITYDAGGASKAEGYKQWVGQEAFAQLHSWLNTGQRPGSLSFLVFLAAALPLSRFSPRYVPRFCGGPCIPPASPLASHMR